MIERVMDALPVALVAFLLVLLAFTLYGMVA